MSKNNGLSNSDEVIFYHGLPIDLYEAIVSKEYALQIFNTLLNKRRQEMIRHRHDAESTISSLKNKIIQTKQALETLKKREALYVKHSK